MDKSQRERAARLCREPGEQHSGGGVAGAIDGDWTVRERPAHTNAAAGGQGFDDVVHGDLQRDRLGPRHVNRPVEQRVVAAIPQRINAESDRDERTDAKQERQRGASGGTKVQQIAASRTVERCRLQLLDHVHDVLI